MACAKKSCVSSPALTDEHKNILATMGNMVSPLACKEIAQAAGLDNKALGCKLKSLQGMGYIDSPVRCKYAITDAGKQAMASA